MRRVSSRWEHRKTGGVPVAWVAAVVFAALATSQSTIAMPPVAVRSAAAVAFAALAASQSINIDWSGGSPKLDIPQPVRPEAIAEPTEEERHAELLQQALEINTLDIPEKEKMRMFQSTREALKEELREKEEERAREEELRSATRLVERANELAARASELQAQRAAELAATRDDEDDDEPEPERIDLRRIQAQVDADGRVHTAAGVRETQERYDAWKAANPDVPRGSMKATLKRLGAQLPPGTDNEAALRAALDAELSRVPVKTLRGLLFERGGSCTGCSERAEFEAAVVKSLANPLVGRHALPLFVYDRPLFPMTTSGLNLYEPRYKLLCRKVLKADQIFGFVVGSAGIGTLAKIKTWRFANDDARDGNCEMKVVGLRRFRLGRAWEDGNNLHYADVSFFNDTDASETEAVDSVALVKQSLKLHYALTSTAEQTELIDELGDTPTARDTGYAMSMWLAAACVSAHKACRPHASKLLAGTSTVARLRKVVEVQSALVDKKFKRRG